MAFPDSHVGKTSGDGINSSPKLREGEMAARSGVDEGNFTVVGPSRDECCDIDGIVPGERDWVAFAIEC